jgi:transposase
LSAPYHRLAARRGKRKAVIAVGHTILVTVYYLLARDQAYEDLGPDFFELRDRAASERRSIRRLEALGYQVTLEPLVPAPPAA